MHFPLEGNKNPQRPFLSGLIDICWRSLYLSSSSISVSLGDEQFFLAVGALVCVAS